MKRTVLSVLFIAVTLSSYAQKQANVWYFGYAAGIDFNSGSPVNLSNGALNTNEGCASIADKTTGQSLFYTDGITVYNRNNAMMTNGSGLLGNSSTTQSGVIIPKPGSTTLFYVFTLDAQVGDYTGNDGDFCYNIVDMSQSGGLGSVTVKNTVLADSMTEKIAAYPSCDGLGYWVVVHKWDSNWFFAYLITSTGISAPVISITGTVHADLGSGNNAESIGYMKISPDGSMIAVACDYNLHTAEVLPFDNSTGAVGAPIMTDNNTWPVGMFGPYGITFSPDNTLLYVGVESGNLYQYNLKAGNAAAIIASRIQLATSISPGALQIAPDGKIYVARNGSSFIDVINNPNTVGFGCNYQAMAVTLTGRCAFGLPDMVESFLYHPAPYAASLSYSSCAGNNILPFTDSTLGGSITALWNFGDPASGTSDSSTLQNPTHAFSSSGNYTVTVYLTNKCITDTLTQSVNVTSGAVNASASPADTAFCAGNFAQLQASGGDTYSWLPTTGLSDPNIANPFAVPSVSTSYTVTISSSCADSTAIVNITVYPAPPIPNIVQSNDTLFCSFDSTYISYQWYYNDSLLPADTLPYVIISGNGNYNVAVTNNNGCLISVGVIILGVENFSSQQPGSLTLYPNPAQDQLTVSGLQLTAARTTIEIKDVLGQIVSPPTSFQKSEEKTVIDISSLSKGIYFVQVVGEKGRLMGRFVKE